MIIRFSLLLLIATFSLRADDSSEVGQTMAEQMRAGQPSKESIVYGTLQIRAGKIKTDIPAICQVKVSQTNWETIYETGSINETPAERLVIIHQVNQPNQYLYAQAPAPNAPLPEPKPISAAQAAHPLAGSDFWLSDLALEFLHWPGQRKLKDGKAMGQECYLLESSNTNRVEMDRVVSWIDKESFDQGSGGLLRAEGYQGTNLVKEFSLSGSSFVKVNGEYKLEKMKITSPLKKSQTTLKFDLSPNK